MHLPILAWTLCDEEDDTCFELFGRSGIVLSEIFVVEIKSRHQK
jgi:hypothetical protein